MKTSGSIHIDQLFDGDRADLAGLEESLGPRDAVIRSIIDRFCATYGLLLWSLAKTYRAGIYESLEESFSAGFIGSQFHDSAAMNDTTVRFSGGAALDDSDFHIKSEEVIDPSAHTEVMKLYLVFLFSSQNGKLCFLLLDFFPLISVVFRCTLVFRFYLCT